MCTLQKKKKIRKKTEEDEQGDGEMQLEPIEEDTTSQDHGSRTKANSTSQADKLAAEQAEKLAAYNRAKMKAQLETDHAKR